MKHLFVLGAMLFVATACGAARHARPVSSGACGPIQSAGSAKPRFLIVSDLPLRAPPGAQEQVSGIEYILKARGYRAGKYVVGYQSCDDSSAAAGSFDGTVCTTNAKDYSADASVIGVIGPYNSPCAALEIPLLNAAPKGPLAMIGTGTTDPTLTTHVPGGPSGSPDVYYPTGIRNFVRLPPPDQYQAAAGAMLAAERRFRRVFVLDDGEAFGANLSRWFRQDAVRLHVRTVGSATWDPRAKDYAALANRVLRARPDSVYLSGYAFLHGTKVLKALRAAGGQKLEIFAPDGFSDPNEDVAEAGSAANGLEFTLAGVPPEAASALGKTIVQTTGPEPPEQYGSLFGAAAASALLDAIAHSNGTRRSVTSELFRAHTPGSIIGRFGFNRNGDPSNGAVAVYRIAAGKLVFAQLLRPSATLAEPLHP